MTVPVLHHGDGWLTESWEIARWAERVGSGTSLFPESKLSTIEHFEALSERGLASGRALATTRMLAQPRLAASMAPPAVRASLGPLAAALASVAMRRTLRKYGAGSLSLTGHKSELRRVLDALREALAQRSGDGDAVPTLLGTFSYADIVAAQVLQFVTPRNLGRFELGPEGQEGYRDAELSSEYADLDDWRVRLYAAYDPSHQEVLGAGPYVRTFRGVR